MSGSAAAVNTTSIEAKGSSSPSSKPQLNFLMMEDNHIQQKIMGQKLMSVFKKQYQPTVTVADDPVVAEEKFRQTKASDPFHVVIMDINNPRYENAGFACAGYLREVMGYNGIIVMWSTNNSQYLSGPYYAKYFNYFLDKAVLPDQMDADQKLQDFVSESQKRKIVVLNPEMKFEEYHKAWQADSEFYLKRKAAHMEAATVVAASSQVLSPSVAAASPGSDQTFAAVTALSASHLAAIPSAAVVGADDSKAASLSADVDLKAVLSPVVVVTNASSALLLASSPSTNSVSLPSPSSEELSPGSSDEQILVSMHAAGVDFKHLSKTRDDSSVSSIYTLPPATGRSPNAHLRSLSLFGQTTGQYSQSASSAESSNDSTPAGIDPAQPHLCVVSPPNNAMSFKAPQ
ncbi:MAG: hypothetical protein M1561_00505 [Gammaproteobacteria bacterium]|nr:hypothetical protein [Gammaproteobacteria bacterium]